MKGKTSAMVFDRRSYTVEEIGSYIIVKLKHKRNKSRKKVD